MEKFLNVTKNFLNFVKNNLSLLLAAFFLLDFIIGVFFTSVPADTTEKRIKFINLTIDLIWVFILFESYTTTRIEKLLNKRISLVEAEVGLMYDTIRKAVEASEKEKEAAEKEEKAVEQK